MFHSIIMVSIKTSYTKTTLVEDGLNETDITHQVAVCFDILVAFLLLRVPQEEETTLKEWEELMCA